MNNHKTDCSSIVEKIRDLQNRQNTLALGLYQLSKPTIAALPLDTLVLVFLVIMASHIFLWI